jgi:membrane protease YdiL (CAAX protease family)
VVGPAIVVIVPLVAAAWLPPGFPHLVRQALLCTWGVGAILVAERMLFSNSLKETLRAVGFVRARKSTLEVALLVSLPMWAFLPLLAWTTGTAMDLRPEWLSLLLGVVLVNGVTEEVIHRGFVFGHLRRGRSFATAATISAMLFAAQHLYIIVTTGWTTGLASVLLAALLAYPMAFVFERGANSIAGPAILHTSSNAPVMILAPPEDFMTTALLPHMGVIIVSLYLLFAVQQFFIEKRRPSSYLPRM